MAWDDRFPPAAYFCDFSGQLMVLQQPVRACTTLQPVGRVMAYEPSERYTEVPIVQKVPLWISCLFHGDVFQYAFHDMACCKWGTRTSAKRHTTLDIPVAMALGI